MKITIIAAASDNAVIGKDNKLLWNLPDDMKFFKEKTMGHTVVVGRKTFESIPEKFRPLPGRNNIVITSQTHLGDGGGYVIAKSLKSALEFAQEEDEVFVIGGAQVYNDAMPLADKIYLTHVFADLDGDVFFPEINPEERKITSILPHLKDDLHEYEYELVELERETVNYFSYGSNMDPTVMSAYAKIIDKPVTGVLKHFVVEFNKQSFKTPTNGFANIVPQWEGVTEGVIYRIRKSDMGLLDKKEGFPAHYQKIELPISCTYANGYEYTLNCIVYVANFWRQKRGLNVSDEYKAKISTGSALLSESYRNMLLKKMNS